MPTPAAGSAGYVLAMVLSCGFFMACSAGMMIVNKMVIRSVHMPNTIVMIQMAFTVLLLCAYPCGLHFGSLKDVKRWSLTVPWLFTVMLASSMLSLRYSSMGAIVVMRNISPLVSLCIEGVFTGEKIEIDVWTLLSLLVVLSGVVLYVSHDIAFSPIGMLCMIANLAAGVFERLLQRKMIAVEPIDINKTGMMLLNNSISMVPMTGMILASGEAGSWHEFRNLSRSGWALLFASCVNAVGISWAGINAQAYVTATTFMVLANLNKFVVVGFGIVVLQEASSWQAVVGCCCALGGGLLYARARTNLARKAVPRETSQEISKRLIMSAVDEEEEEVAMK